MATLTLLAPAKLNLFLHITGRRDDGYHELQTYFQLIDLCDELSFDCHDSPEISLQCSDSRIDNDQNLVLKAAKLLQTATATSRGCTIRLTKHIPMQAGLGGGSSDAATTLLALNELWQTQCSKTDLLGLALQLGADVPVFVHGQSAWGEGIGEQLTSLPGPDCWYLVVVPPVAVSTPEIFSNPQLTRDSIKLKMGAFPGDWRNDCEAVVRRRYPEVAQCLEWLSQYGQARLTGTGSACYVAFDNETDALNSLQQIPSDSRGFVAKSLEQSHSLKNDWGVAKW